MPTPSPDAIVSGLVYPLNAWTSATLTFSIPRQGSVWTGYAADGLPNSAQYAPLNAQQADSFRTAVGDWARLIGRPIVETDDLAAPGMIRIAFGDTGIHGALAVPPPAIGGQPTPVEPQGDVWLNPRIVGDGTLAPGANPGGGVGYFTLLHELGHALGLKHPHDGETTLPFEWTNNRYTVMGYDAVPDLTIFSYSPNPQLSTADRAISLAYLRTPMVFDILAIQSRYGANPATNAGATAYTWQPFKPYLEAIYDASGVDTFDLSSHTLPSIVDLTPGAYSSIGYWSVAEQQAYWTSQVPQGASLIARDFANAASIYTGRDNVGIAYGTIIENVVAGAGHDTVTGNVAANRLDGGAGDDRIFGAAGGDTLTGGAGANYLRGDEGDDAVTGGSGFDDINGNTGDDVAAGGAGDDWVVGGKDRDRLFGDDGADIVYGNLGDDTCEGGTGADLVRGGQGDDVVSGGEGADWLAGDRGADTLSGGAGADVFHTHGETGLDRVTDFNAADGDRINLLAGVTYTLSQSGADTVVDMAGGGRLVLAGVQLASLPAGWIFAG